MTEQRSESHSDTIHEVVENTASTSREGETASNLATTLGEMNKNMSEIAGILLQMRTKRGKLPRQEFSDPEHDSESELNQPKRKKDDSAEANSEDNLSIHAEEDLDVDQDILKLTEQTQATGQKKRETPGDDDESKLLQKLASQLDDDEATGEKVQKELAEIAQKRWGKTLTSAKMKTFVDKYKAPENCTGIKGSKVNTEIWSQLNNKKRSADLNLSNMQQTIRKIIFANLQTTNALLGNPTGESLLSKVLGPQVESLAMLMLRRK